MQKTRPSHTALLNMVDYRCVFKQYTGVMSMSWLVWWAMRTHGGILKVTPLTLLALSALSFNFSVDLSEKSVLDFRKSYHLQILISSCKFYQGTLANSCLGDHLLRWKSIAFDQGCC